MSKGRKIVGTCIRSILIIVFAIIIVAVNNILPNYARMVDSMLGGINTKIDPKTGEEIYIKEEPNKIEIITKEVIESKKKIKERSQLNFEEIKTIELSNNLNESTYSEK